LRRTDISFFFTIAAILVQQNTTRSASNIHPTNRTEKSRRFSVLSEDVNGDLNSIIF
jgi:hypothetical protein